VPESDPHLSSSPNQIIPFPIRFDLSDLKPAKR
jgi:hypothetical protein